jgi:predicted CoA-binding protein
MSKKTLVMGASENVQRYSNMAIRKLKQFGHEVKAV